MVSRYHWVTTGIDQQTALALPNLQANPVTIPAGATLKRFIVRSCSYLANNNGTGGNNAYGLNVKWDIHFTSGPNNGRSIYTTRRMVPLVATIFTPITGSNVYAWWAAGDNELGINEKCSYGTRAGAAANLQPTYSFLPQRFASHSNLFGEWIFEFAALYYL